jgi:hypothetical protein
MRVGITDLPLHYGSCPPWLFKRMKLLGKNICEAIVMEFGTSELIRRLSNPFFFQAFACVLGFDWHSSGTTTTLCGALKEARLEEIGVAVLGGKGGRARKVPQEIEEIANQFGFSEKTKEELVNASRLAAKVDSSCLQDGFDLYHHSFFVDERGNWAVIQQGMNVSTKYARRYHWLSETLQSFVVEPHYAICCDYKGKALNLVANESEEARKCIVDLAKENPSHVKKYLLMAKSHTFDKTKYMHLLKSIEKTYEEQPASFEELLAIRGIGAKTLRALALISKLIYGCEISWRDPVKYSFAHGGKDKVPYPIDKRTYDKSIEILRTAIEQAKIGEKEKLFALRKLNKWIKED